MDTRSPTTRAHVLSRHLLRAHWPEAAIFALACALALAWFGRGAGLLMLPFGLLGGLLIAERRGRTTSRVTHRAAADALRPLRAAIDARLLSMRKSDATFALVIARIDAGAGRVATSCLDRLSRVLRDDDLLFDLSQGRVAILLAPGPGLDRGALTALGTRLRDALSGSGAGVTLGICMADASTDRSGRAMIRAAESALAQAALDGAPAIRFHGAAGADAPRARPETA